MTSHFDESIMIGTREMSGSLAISFRKRSIAAFESSIASSMLMSITCAPFSTCWRATASASSKRPSRIMRAKAFRAGDVGALADVDEQRVLADVERLQARQAQLLLDLRNGARRLTPATPSAIAAMCRARCRSSRRRCSRSPLPAPSRRSRRPAVPAFRRSRRRRWAGRRWGGPRRSSRRRATVPRRTGAVPSRRARS
jgi:hypothetical protein